MKRLMLGPVLRGASITVASLLSLNCFNKPMAPVAPKWDVGFTAPVSNRSYTLGDIVAKDSSILSVVPGGTQLRYRNLLQTAPTYVGDLIKLDPINSNFTTSLGAFSVFPINISIPVPLPAGLSQNLPVPPMSNVAIPPVSGGFPTFRQVTFKSGTLRLNLQNNLPVAVTLQNPIVLRDSSGNSIVTFFSAGSSIPARGALFSDADIAEKTFTSTIQISDIVISESGSAQTLQSSTLMMATLTGTNLAARSAVLAQIPPQVLFDNAQSSFALTDSTRVQEVRVKSGTMFLHVASQVNLSSIFKVRLPQLFRAGGAQYQDSVMLPARGVSDITINLGGLRLASTNGKLLSAVDVVSTVNLYQGSGGSPVIVNENDHVNISVSSSVIVADSAVGVVKPTMLRVDKKVPLDLGDLARKLRATLRLASADMSFSPISCIAFPMDLNLQLQAKRPGSSTPEVLQIPPSKVGSGTQSIVFDPVDVARFLSNISGQFPDSVRVVGSVTVNPEYDTTVVGCVGRNSSFSGALDLSIPLNLSISDGAFADTALFGDTTGSGERENRIDDKALNDVNYGKLYIEIENGLPMQVAMKIALLDRSKKFLLGLPQVPGDSIRISPAMVAGGEVQSPVKSVTVLQLQSSEVRQFNPAEFVQYAITLVTPPGQMVNFRTTDMVRVRIWAEFSYEVNP